MPYPQQTFSNFAALLAYINTQWITNGNGDITGVVGNNVVNGLLTFIEQSPLNWQKAQIIQTTENATASRPVVVFIQDTPSQLSWSDNIYYEFVFINTTAEDIPLASGLSYLSVDLVAQTSIPAYTSVNIVKANNDLWIVRSVDGLIGDPPKALRGVVGTTADFPEGGDTSWQSDFFIGLGGDDNEYSFIRDGIIVMSYGNSKSFDFDNDAGLITLIDGEFIDGEGLDAPLLKKIN